MTNFIAVRKTLLLAANMLKALSQIFGLQNIWNIKIIGNSDPPWRKYKYNFITRVRRKMGAL